MKNLKLKICFTFLLAAFFCSMNSFGQQAAKYKVAVFAPLYLDSAFDSNFDYKFSKNSFPKYISPGLEFYEGVQLALDSLNNAKTPLEVFIYDTKSTSETVSQQLDRSELNDVQLLIAYATNSDLKIFADAGLKKNIPVINVNLPNDGGVSGNPFFVLLNPTLKTQCEGIYKYIQKYNSLDPVVVFRKKGQLEDRIKMYFEDFGKSTVSVPLKFKYVDLPDNFSANDLKQYLDTTQQTLAVAGSLDESFGKKLVQQLATLNKQDYPCTVLGMPTWDNISFNKKDYQGIEITYSTPFYHSKTDRISQGINTYFNKVMYARPSDMVFRGYEIMLRFGKLLSIYGKDLASNLSTRQSKVFTDFDIQPVLNRGSMSLEYFENKKLYFLKWEDGALKGVY
jgi:hypothetical protein